MRHDMSVFLLLLHGTSGVACVRPRCLSPGAEMSRRPPMSCQLGGLKGKSRARVIK